MIAAVDDGAVPEREVVACHIEAGLCIFLLRAVGLRSTALWHWDTALSHELPLSVAAALRQLRSDSWCLEESGEAGGAGG